MSLFPSDDDLEIIKVRHKIQLGNSTKERYLTFMVIVSLNFIYELSVFILVLRSVML